MYEEKFKQLALWDVVIHNAIVSRFVNGQKTYVQVGSARVLPTNVHPTYYQVVGRNLTFEEAETIVKMYNLGVNDGDE